MFFGLVNMTADLHTIVRAQISASVYAMSDRYPIVTTQSVLQNTAVVRTHVSLLESSVLPELNR